MDTMPNTYKDGSAERSLMDRVANEPLRPDPRANRYSDRRGVDYNELQSKLAQQKNAYSYFKGQLNQYVEQNGFNNYSRPFTVSEKAAAEANRRMAVGNKPYPPGQAVDYYTTKVNKPGYDVVYPKTQEPPAESNEE